MLKLNRDHFNNSPNSFKTSKLYKMIVFLNGQYLPCEDAKVSVQDRGFLFGDGLYEVITVYQGKPFRMDDHLKRLRDGVNALRISGVDPDIFHEVGRRLLQENELTRSDCTLYIQVTRGEAPRLHGFPTEGVEPTLFMAATPLSAKSRFPGKTIRAILVPDLRWMRCDIKTISLIANVLARQRAIDERVQEAILVRNGVALEGTFTTLFAVFDGIVVTNANTNYILPGVTRDVVLELCRQEGIPYKEGSIFEHEIHNADEIFVTSTSMEIVPVIALDHKPIADGDPGPVTKQLQHAFRRMIDEFLKSPSE